MINETVTVSLDDLKIVVDLLAAKPPSDDSVEHVLCIIQNMIAKHTPPPRTPEEEGELQRIYDAEWYDIQVRANAEHEPRRLPENPS